VADNYVERLALTVTVIVGRHHGVAAVDQFGDIDDQQIADLQ
jgi:hypothetical protein